MSSHVGTLALPGKYDWTCASFGPPESTTQTANNSVQPFLYSSLQILYNGRPFPPKLSPHMGDLDTPSNTWFLGPKRHLDWFSLFCTDDRRVFLYFTMWRHYPLKIAPSHRGSRPPSNTWFPGPTPVLNPNGILTGSAIFAGLTSVTDWQTTVLGG